MTAVLGAYTETVTLHRLTGHTTDDTGNDVPTYADETTQAAVWPVVSDESAVAGGDVVTRGLAMLLPSTYPVDALDEATVRGSRYKVQGDPDVYHSPLTGTEVTHVLMLRRT
jgi:hypothetical protein